MALTLVIIAAGITNIIVLAQAFALFCMRRRIKKLESGYCEHLMNEHDMPDIFTEIE